jgi:hypothetical protein
MTWTAVSANSFPNGAEDLEHAVVQNEVWAITASMLFLGYLLSLSNGFCLLHQSIAMRQKR